MFVCDRVIPSKASKGLGSFTVAPGERKKKEKKKKGKEKQTPQDEGDEGDELVSNKRLGSRPVSTSTGLNGEDLVRPEVKQRGKETLHLVLEF